jgi:hypothetical protein
LHGIEEEWNVEAVLFEKSTQMCSALLAVEMAMVV